MVEPLSRYILFISNVTISRKNDYLDVFTSALVRQAIIFDYFGYLRSFY